MSVNDTPPHRSLIADLGLKQYSRRETTHREHAGEIQHASGLRDFSTVEADLARWLDARAWTTGEGPKALFDGSVAWLRERRVLLPGISTLTRLIAQVRGQATDRLYATVCELVTPPQRLVLDLLLEVPEGARISPWDRLRRGPGHPSGPQLRTSARPCRKAY